MPTVTGRFEGNPTVHVSAGSPSSVVRLSESHTWRLAETSTHITLAHPFLITRWDSGTHLVFCRGIANIRPWYSHTILFSANKHCWNTFLFLICVCILQEVSAFGENGEGDDLDLWTVQCDGDHWERDEAVRFKHMGTDVFLSVTGEQYGHPIRGQREVHGMRSANQHNWWRSMEGVFIQPSQEPLRHDELW